MRLQSRRAGFRYRFRPPEPGRYQAGYLALPAARYHPPGVEQERAGLDELGRISSEKKEKEALWLT